MSDTFFKSFSKTVYNFVLDEMKIEGLAHPETYETAARIGANLRDKLVDLGQVDDLKPIPMLNKEK